MRKTILTLVLVVLLGVFAPAQQNQQRREVPKAPPRAEGEGPYPGLILRGGILIDGTGAPPIGPVDIVVRQNRIVRVQTTGQHIVRLTLCTLFRRLYRRLVGIMVRTDHTDSHAFPLIWAFRGIYAVLTRHQVQTV